MGFRSGEYFGRRINRSGKAARHGGRGRRPRLEEKEAVVAVPEALVDRLSKGTAKVSLWSQPDRVYDARLRELSPGADAATRTYRARFTILNAGDDVRFGMTATVTLSDPASGQVARLPLSAVIDEGQGARRFSLSGAQAGRGREL